MNNISRRTFLKGASACSMGLAAGNMLGMLGPVSYTHLDVYKRQASISASCTASAQS